MKILEDQELQKMWNISISSSLESGTRPHIIFAKLLYNNFTKCQFDDEDQNSIGLTS